MISHTALGQPVHVWSFKLSLAAFSLTSHSIPSLPLQNLFQPLSLAPSVNGGFPINLTEPQNQDGLDSGDHAAPFTTAAAAAAAAAATTAAQYVTASPPTEDSDLQPNSHSQYIP